MKLGVFLLWNVLSVGVLFLPLHPLLVTVVELAVVALFVQRYLLPRRPAAGGGRGGGGAKRRDELARLAVLRLRGVPRRAWGVLAAWLGATLVLDTLVTMVYFHLVPRAADYPDPFTDLLARPLGWLPVYTTMVLAAPLMEEAAFRGWVQRPLERAGGVPLAIALSSLLFALAHGLAQLIPYYLAAGAALGVTVYLTRSLWAGVAAHAAHNAWSVGSDGLGLTNEQLIAWGARPAVFWLAAAALAGWVVVMVWLGRKMQRATRERGRPASLLPRPLSPA